jgi:hypothetical protein
VRSSVDYPSGAKHRRTHSKRARFAADDKYENEGSSFHGGVPKHQDDIPVPNPTRKPLSRPERLLAIIMAPGDSHARMHGLHGKKLMFVVIPNPPYAVDAVLTRSGSYFTSIFVSLGVFLFGYDQGVMSGIIT